jgi:hypothetical protein
MATTPFSSPMSALTKPTFACTRCAERKVKCDRQRPCRACANHKVDCVFQPPRPPQRRQKNARNQILTDRLRYYEALLQDQGIDTSRLPDVPSSSPRQKSNQGAIGVAKEPHKQYPPTSEYDASGDVSKTQVIHGEGHSIFVEK